MAQRQAQPLCTVPFRSCDGTLDCYTTSMYKLHFYETATGLKFVLTTDPKTPALQEQLAALYSGHFVDDVVRNPLYTMHEPIESRRFNENVTAFFKAMPFYAR